VDPLTSMAHPVTMLRHIRWMGFAKKNFALLLIGLCTLVAVARFFFARAPYRPPSVLLKEAASAPSQPPCGPSHSCIGSEPVVLPTAERPKKPPKGVDWDRNQHEVDMRKWRVELTDEDRVTMPVHCAHRSEEREPLHVDDQGRICLDHNVDHDSGCCVPSKQLARFTCQHCVVPEVPSNPRIKHDICCDLHADCTSCCMDHRRTAADGTKRNSTSKQFIKCVYECRTSSRSLSEHGRGYKYGENHHCFTGVEHVLTLEHFAAQSDEIKEQEVVK
jgi:hypothetical protein